MSKFNIRVYGLILQNHKILVSQEQYRHLEVIKFPGGGLEYGEGLIDALKREFVEEFGLEIDGWAHYYTTDFFQKSKFDESQVISVYYKYTGDFDDKIYHTDTGIASFQELNEALLSKISMPIDQHVVRKLLQEKRA